MTTPSSSVARQTLTAAKHDAEHVTKVASKSIKSIAKKASQKTLSVAKDLAVHLPGVAKLELPAPPVTGLLQSNMPPSDYEASLLSAALLQAEAEWQRLDTKLAQGDSNWKDGWKAVMKHKTELAVQFIRQHKAVLSPIRRLPPDVIQEIFQWFTFPPSPTAEWSDIPWILGHICRQWRDVALSASILWYRIPEISLDKKSIFRRRVLNELFLRSGDRLLQLSIISSSHHLNYPLVDVLIRHSTKWQFVKFTVPSSVFLDFRTTKGRLPNLRRLAIISTSSESEVARSKVLGSMLDMFKTAPLLEEVSVNGTIPRQMVFPFSQLLHYRHQMVWDVPADCLYDSPLLKSLTLLGLSGNLPSVCSLTLHHLVKLHLSSDNNTDIEFLDNLTLPAIEELKLDSLRGNVLSAVAAMISRSPSSSLLKNLCLRSGPFEQSEIISLLQLTPQLLNLDIPVPSTTVINALVSGYEGKPLTPFLRTCNFHIAGMVSTETTRALRLLASSRCEALIQGRSEVDDNMIEGELRPIELLRVYFDSPFSRLTNFNLFDPIIQQAALEDWNPSSTSAELQRLRRQLHAAFPASLLAQDTKFDKRRIDRVDGILSSIEGLNMTDPKDIYLSEIHLSLERLSKFKILNANGLDMSNRARDILKKWNILFEQSLKDRHWVFQGMNSIIYISEDHALRNSTNALSIVYGLPGNSGRERSGDVFWLVN